MTSIALLIYTAISWLLRIVEFLMLVRAIFSWIPVPPPALSGIYRAVYTLTEPLINPFRRLLNRFAFVRSCPIDLSFLAAIIALEIIGRLFYVVCIGWMF